MKKERCAAVVLAGGRGKRMGTTLAKQYLMLRDRPVIWYSLDVFERSPWMDEVVLVAGKGQIPYCRQEVVDKYGFQKVKAVVEGGAERYHSVWEGLFALRQMGWKDGYVFIHDGARPFVCEEILERAYKEVCQSRACVVGMPVKDTIKIADEQGCIHMTPKRSLVWQIQTPQAFSYERICRAYERMFAGEAGQRQITDDAMVMEICGDTKVKMVSGDSLNIKITTEEDIVLAESILKQAEI